MDTKLKLALSTILLGANVFAADVPVYNSIYMAVHSNSNPHANVLKLMDELRKTSYERVEHLRLTLVNAIVNTESETVKYTFADVVNKANRVQCTFNLVFTVKPGKSGDSQLLDAKASEDCQRDD